MGFQHILTGEGSARALLSAPLLPSYGYAPTNGKEIITDNEEDGTSYHCQGIHGATILPSRSAGCQKGAIAIDFLQQ